MAADALVQFGHQGISSISSHHWWPAFTIGDCIQLTVLPWLYGIPNSKGPPVDLDYQTLTQHFTLDWYINGLAQDCSNSIANALELLQSCAKPSVWFKSIWETLLHQGLLWACCEMNAIQPRSWLAWMFLISLVLFGEIRSYLSIVFLQIYIVYLYLHDSFRSMALL